MAKIVQLLFNGVYGCDVDKVNAAIKYGAHINQLNDKNETPYSFLTNAIYGKNFLVEDVKNASENGTNASHTQINALNTMARFSFTDTLKQMGGSPACDNVVVKEIAMFDAIKKNDLVRFMQYASRTNINHMNYEGRTPMDLVLGNNVFEEVVHQYNGKTASELGYSITKMLFDSIEQLDIVMVQLALEYGANDICRNNSGQSPINVLANVDAKFPHQQIEKNKIMKLFK